MQKAGFQIIHNGDEDGTGLFDPQDPKQVQVALSVARPYRRMQYSPEVLEKLRENLALAHNATENRNRGVSGGPDSIAAA